MRSRELKSQVRPTGFHHNRLRGFICRVSYFQNTSSSLIRELNVRVRDESQKSENFYSFRRNTACDGISFWAPISRNRDRQPKLNENNWTTREPRFRSHMIARKTSESLSTDQVLCQGCTKGYCSVKARVNLMNLRDWRRSDNSIPPEATHTHRLTMANKQIWRWLVWRYWLVLSCSVSGPIDRSKWLKMATDIFNFLIVHVCISMYKRLRECFRWGIIQEIQEEDACICTDYWY